MNTVKNIHIFEISFPRMKRGLEVQLFEYSPLDTRKITFIRISTLVSI
jgi:hypothetical protein